MNYSRTIKLLRAVNGWTQKDLAAKVGVSNSYFCVVEDGKRALPFHMQKKLAAAFGLPDLLFSALSCDTPLTEHQYIMFGEDLLRYIVEGKALMIYDRPAAIERLKKEVMNAYMYQLRLLEDEERDLQKQLDAKKSEIVWLEKRIKSMNHNLQRANEQDLRSLNFFF